MTRLIAPPGVPLVPPEPIDELMRWRGAAWSYGRMLESPRTLTLTCALTLAPSHEEWMRERDDTHQRRDQQARMASLPAATNPGRSRVAHVATVRRLPVMRSPIALARSASTFAAYVRASDSATVVRQIETITNGATSLIQMRADIVAVDAAFGRDAVVEVLTAFIYARSRSHSLRYTKPMARLARHPRSSAGWLLREIDAAGCARALSDTLLGFETRGIDLDGLLTELLFEQSRCARWRLTKPLRLALGTTRLSALRRFLRIGLRPALHTVGVVKPYPINWSVGPVRSSHADDETCAFVDFETLRHRSACRAVKLADPGALPQHLVDSPGSGPAHTCLGLALVIAVAVSTTAIANVVYGPRGATGPQIVETSPGYVQVVSPNAYRRQHSVNFAEDNRRGAIGDAWFSGRRDSTR